MIVRRLGAATALWFALVHASGASPLNMVTGNNKDKAPLETLSASPDLPKADALSYSPDNGHGSRDAEVVPLSIAEAAKLSDMSHLPAAGYPSIPSSPYIMQPVPASLAHISTWTFLVTDDQAKTWNKQVVVSSRAPTFSWDGNLDGKFVLDPNLSYVSLLKATQTDGNVTTFPGQAARFPVFLRQDKGNIVIVFGERVYADNNDAFSDMAKIYLDDLVRRLALLPPPLPNEWDDRQTWSITLFEPSGNDALGSARVGLWKKFLESQLGLRIPQNKFYLRDAIDNHSRVEVVLKGAALLPLDEIMHAPDARYHPIQDNAADWVAVHSEKEALIVDLRHDSLFRSGTAYLRDEGLPPLIDAMKRVRAELNTASSAKKRPVLLRSFTEKVWDPKKNQEREDPKLSALRSKVLFALFAKEGLLK
jgi:hypothetical protein